MLVTLEEPPGAIKVGPIVSSNVAPIGLDRRPVSYLGRGMSAEGDLKNGR